MLLVDLCKNDANHSQLVISTNYNKKKSFVHSKVVIIELLVCPNAFYKGLEKLKI